MSTSAPVTSQEHIALIDRASAHNYAPLPVVASTAEGAWVTGLDGRRYLDCLSAYSAINFGHANPTILDAVHRQLDRLTLVSRAFHHDQMASYVSELGNLVGKNMVLPMNTGAEAVESGIKVARKWGYDVKGVAPEQANIIVMRGNFHGRTTTIVGFSDDPDARDGFGPFTPGFRSVPYGDAEAAAAAIDDNTVAVLVEPVQGEAGVIVPPPQYLQDLRKVCQSNDILLIADEIQSGLARTGRTLAVEHSDVTADIYLLGKALGGGIVPVSAVVADKEILAILEPGQHGSTFGGNPLACTVGLTVVRMLATGEWQQRAAELGEHLAGLLAPLVGRGVSAVRHLGLWAGVDIDPDFGTGRSVCEAFAQRGVLAKETHGQTIRIAPPLVVTPGDLDWAIEQLADVLNDAAVQAQIPAAAPAPARGRGVGTGRLVARTRVGRAGPRPG